MPRSSCWPKDNNSRRDARATVSEITIDRSSSAQSAARRATRLTAGPITVKSRRVGGADITVHDVADVHRHAAFDGHATIRPVAVVEGGDTFDRFLRRHQRPAASFADRVLALLAGEDRQHGVAHELENLAAAIDHRPGDGVEIGIEQRQYLGQRQLLGQRGEAAQVAVPQHRVDDLAVTALDRAGEDALPGVGADVGVEQVARGAAQLLQLGNRREHR